jgi:peroxiredoxin
MKTNSRFLSVIPLYRIGMIMLLVSAIMLSCQKDETGSDPLTEVEAPGFSLKSLGGDDISLSQMNGKVVVLFFLGNNCPSCRAAASNVESMLVTPFANYTDYQVLGLDTWDGNASAVQSFKTVTGVSFPLLLNASGVAAKFKTTYDRIFVIDKTGKIVFSGTRGAASDIAAAKQKVEMLVEVIALNPDPDPVVDPDPVDPDPVVVGDAPDFTLNSLETGEVKLADHLGKAIVLFFFGNNCPSCKAAAPNIESMLSAPFKDNDKYLILGLDTWNGNANSLQAFKTSTGVTFPLLLNASSVATAYGTTYDRIVVIDKAGNVVFKGSRGAANDVAAVKEKVEEILGK